MKDKQERLVSKLNSIKFRGLEEYHLGASLVLLLEYFDIKKFGYVKLLNFPIYDDTYQIRKNNGSVMFLFSNSYKGRKDYEKWFLKASALLKNRIVIMPSAGVLDRAFSFREKVLMGIWIIQMRKVRLSFQRKLLCANLLISGKRNLEKLIKEIKEKNVRSVITLCDTHLIDYMVTAYCNRNGIKTATLQHGFFPANDKCYKYSESNYFLTYSAYTKKLFDRCNIYKSNCIIAGMPEYINENQEFVRTIKKRKKFLVLLNGSLENGRGHISNERMLRICKKYASQNQCYFDMKPHVDTKDYLDEYKRIASVWGNLVEIKSDKRSFFDQYSFCVANETTMILNAISLLTPILVYQDRNQKPYLLIQNKNIFFSNYKEMENGASYISENNINEFLVRLRRHLCGPDNVAENYMEFFNKLQEEDYYEIL